MSVESVPVAMAPLFTTLPAASLTPLIGRDEELVVLGGQILDPDVRILNLTGPGGVGKSRLAFAVAEQVRRKFRDGITIADLTGVTDGRGALTGLAAELGLPGGADDDGELLLVLDGCERSVAGLATALHELLTAAPGLRVLATSREPLRVYGERMFRVAPLAVPDRGAPVDPVELDEIASVALFVQRARAADPGFSLTADNAVAVAEICARLDGLPLAIELCTGRLRMFQVPTLLDRLRRDGGVLTGGHATAPARHRSMTALVDWSYEPLPAPLRQALVRLSVCVEGFGLRTAEELCELGPGETEEAIEALADRSLVAVREQGGEPRFTILRTVAAYCQAVLAAAQNLEATRDRHARHFARLAADTAPLLNGPAQAAALGRLRAEHDNLQTALAQLTARGEHTAAARLALDLHRYLLIDGHAAEGVRLLDAAADRCARTDPQLAARTRDAAGSLATAVGDPAAAAARHESALAELSALGDPTGALEARARLGAARCLLGDHDTGRELLDTALPELARTRPAGSAEAHLALAAAFVQTGDLRAAQEHTEAALAVYRDLDDTYGHALALRQAAFVAEAEGATERADRLHRHSLRDLREVGTAVELARGLTALGLLLLSCVAGQENRVTRLLGTAEALRKSAGILLMERERAAQKTAVEDLRTRLGALRFETAWRSGERLSADAAALDVLSAPRAEPVENPDGSRARALTARQFQVAMLVGQGMTNRQAAHRLELSEWTVVNHVRQIMRKLDLPSRVHVAQWVSQQRAAEAAWTTEFSGEQAGG